jgi:hypothetical protein
VLTLASDVGERVDPESETCAQDELQAGSFVALGPSALQRFQSSFAVPASIVLRALFA